MIVRLGFVSTPTEKFLRWIQYSCNILLFPVLFLLAHPLLFLGRIQSTQMYQESSEFPICTITNKRFCALCHTKCFFYGGETFTFDQRFFSAFLLLFRFEHFLSQLPHL